MYAMTAQQYYTLLDHYMLLSIYSEVKMVAAGLSFPKTGFLIAMFLVTRHGLLAMADDEPRRLPEEE